MNNVIEAIEGISLGVLLGSALINIFAAFYVYKSVKILLEIENELNK